MGIVFGFCSQMQLNYWLRNWQDAPSLYQVIMKQTTKIAPSTLLHLLKTGTREMAHVATLRCDLSKIELHLFWAEAPIEWLLRSLCPLENQIIIYWSRLSTPRLVDVFHEVDIDTQSPECQAFMLERACKTNDLDFIQWTFQRCSRIGETNVLVHLQPLNPEIIRFLKSLRLTYTWVTSGYKPTSLAQFQAVVGSQIPCDDYFGVADALRDNQFELAVYLWANQPQHTRRFFEKCEWTVQNSPEIRYHFPQEWKFPNVNFQFQPISFDVGVNQGDWRNWTENPTYKRELLPLEKETYYFEVLIYNVINNTDPKSLLHKDTVAWLETLDADIYFAYACKNNIPSLVVYLWQHCPEKHTVWKHMPRRCIFTSYHELIEFVDSIEPIWVRDNVQTLASNALLHENLSLWTFCLPLLSKREVFHVCKQSVDTKYVVFFKEAWSYVEHRHANELFDMALSLRDSGVAQFLLEQPELETQHFEERLQILVFMRLVDAIRMIPKIPFSNDLEPRYSWCAEQALKDENHDMVRALYDILPLDHSKWCELYKPYSHRRAELGFLRVMFELGFITSHDIALMYDDDPFSQDLDIIHGDI